MTSTSKLRREQKEHRQKELNAAIDELNARIYSVINQGGPEIRNVQPSTVISTAAPFSESHPLTVAALISGIEVAIHDNLNLFIKTWKLCQLNE